MPGPKFTVLKIDPEDNIRFIANYLSREKQENTTRPFFEKTIRMFPELRGINLITDESEREQKIRTAVLERLDEKKTDIVQKIEHFKAVFDTFIPEFVDACARLFDVTFDDEGSEITCYVGYLPFYPRSTEDRCFFVSYSDEERVFSGAVHEINHMIFYKKWQEMHGHKEKEPAWPEPLWYLMEIIVDPTLNDERVKAFTLYENKAYPEFYVPGEDRRSIMDKIKECYDSHRDNIGDFLDEAYLIVEREL